MAAKIEPAQSVMLDVVRFAAAVTVFVGHASGIWLTGGVFWQVGLGTNAAVTVFFVLSGYVVTATLKPGTGPADYLATRMSRLWSVVLPALVVTIICDSVGQAVARDFYHGVAQAKTEMVRGLNQNQPLRYLLSGLMVQEWAVFPWTPRQPGTNLPFWSLSYEFTYYVAFAMLLFLKGWRRILAIAALFVCAGAKILLLWPLWLAGAGLWHIRHRIPPAFAWLLVAVGAFGLAGIFLFHELIARLDAAWASALTPLPATHLWAGFSIAAFVAGFDVVSRPLGAAALRVARPVRIVANHTFELYLLHIPLVFLAAALSPSPPGSLLRLLAVYGVAVLGVIIVARWTDSLRGRLRTRIGVLLSPSPASR